MLPTEINYFCQIINFRSRLYFSVPPRDHVAGNRARFYDLAILTRSFGYGLPPCFNTYVTCSYK